MKVFPFPLIERKQYMRYLYIRDFNGALLAYDTYDETQYQVSGVKVPDTIPGEFTFYLNGNGTQVKKTVYLRYYVKGYIGCGDTSGFLRVTYPKGQITGLQDLTTHVQIYIMTVNQPTDYFSLNINNELWRVAYAGNVDKIFIGSGTNPLLKVWATTSSPYLEFYLPIDNRDKVWGMSLTSTTQPDIYADTETAVTLASQDVLNVIFASVPTDAIFMKLYQNTAGSTVVDKTSFLTEVDTVPGVLRKQCSVSDPVITIKYEGKPAANYCQIEEFKRYYYINDIVNIAKDLWELYLKSDPLFSFKDEYLNSLVTILRSSSSSIYNRLYHDNLMPIPNKLTRSRSYSTLNPLSPAIISKTDSFHFVLSTFVDHTVQQDMPDPAETSPALGIGKFGYYYPLGVSMYAINWQALNSLGRIFANGGPKITTGDTQNDLSSIFGTDDFSPYILSLRAYPLNFSALTDGTHFVTWSAANVHTVPCGKVLLTRAPATVTGIPLSPINPVVDFGTITLPTPSSFLDTEPNTRAILHLPYVGDNDIDLVEYAGLTIRIMYYLDIYTGNVKAVVRNNSDNAILMSFSGKMGVDVPMILNNMTKGESERTGQAIKLGTSVASLVAGAVGTAAGTPLAGGLIGGAVGLMGNTIATPFFNTPAQSKQFAAGDITEFFTDQRVYLETIKPEDNFNLFYAREYGVPANKIINLSDNTVSGFTVVSPNSRITHPVEATLNEYDEICSALKSGVVI